MLRGIAKLFAVAMAAALATAGMAQGSNPPLGALKALPSSIGCVRDATAPSNFTGCPVVGDGLRGAITAVVSPDGKNVYVSGSESGAVAIFKRDGRTGALEQASGGAGCVKAGDSTGPARCSVTARGVNGVIGLAVSPDGRSVYAAGENDSAIAAFRRDPQTGALSQLPGADACVQDSGPDAGQAVCPRRVLGLHGVRWVTVSPDGQNVYATAPSGHSIAAFRRDTRTGALTQLPGAAACLEDHGDDDPNSGLPNGTLKSNCEQKAKGLSYPRTITVSPDGRNAYVADDFGDDVAQFKRDPRTGALTQLGGSDACIEDSVNAPGYTDCPSSAPSVNGAFSVAVAPDGRNAYVASDAGDALTAFSRDRVTGALHRLPGPAACIRNNDAPASTKCDVTGNGLLGAELVTLSPDGRTVYVAAFHGMAVSAFSRDETSGALTQLPGGAGCIEDLRADQHTTTRCQARADGLYQPRIVAVSPDGRNAYVPTSVGDTVMALSLSTKGSPLRFEPAVKARSRGGSSVIGEIGIALLAIVLLAGAGLAATRYHKGRHRRRYKRWVAR